MPFTGFDAPEPGGPIDMSGGGADPSYYYALSPGGRFPGDLTNFLEYLGAVSRGTNGANPGYDVPDFLEKLPGLLGGIFRSHESNVRNGGPGTVSNPIGGYPYQGFSGPAAPYGPIGGPLHGLFDQGSPGIWDGPEWRPPGESPPPTTKKPRGRGGSHAPSSLPQYGGIQSRGSFLAWQPTDAFGDPSGGRAGASLQAPLFVPGQGSSTPARPAPPPARSPRGGRGGNQQPPAGGGSGGGAQRPQPPAKPGSLPSPPPGSGGGAASSGNPYLDFILNLLGSGGGVTPSGGLGVRGGQGIRTGSGIRAQNPTGVNTNNLDMSTPGWLRDPTAGVVDTAGMPNGTPVAPRPGQSWDDYLNQLSDAGMSVNELMNFIGGRYGYTRQNDGQWTWDWGTGPVVRGANGYQFARDAGGSIGGGGGGNGITDTMSDFFRQRPGFLI